MRNVYTNVFLSLSGGVDVQDLVKILEIPPSYHGRKVECTQHDAIVGFRLSDMTMILPDDMNVGDRSTLEYRHRLVLY